MEWYFAQGTERFGPFADADFRRLVGEGHVRAATPVWSSGLRDWQAFATVSSQVLAGAGEETPETPAGAPEFCWQCGRYCPEQDLLTFRGARICGLCKPTFFQRMWETGLEAALAPPVTVAAAQTSPYADFGARLAATFIDGVGLVVLSVAAFALLLDGAGGLRAEWVMLGWYGTFVAVRLLYETLSVAAWGATLGKRVCGVRVADAAGGRCLLGRALLRAAARSLTEATLGVGYVMMAWDRNRRTLHDRLAGTLAFKAGRGGPPA